MPRWPIWVGRWRGKGPAAPLVSVLAMADSANNKIRIRLFAGLREQAGWAERQWAQAPSPGESPTPRQLWQRLELPGLLIDVRVAINQWGLMHTGR